MKKTMLLTAVLLVGSLSAVWAQSMTKQQALDEIARIERFNRQVDEMLRQAWEAVRTQRETVIDTPYGKVTVKFLAVFNDGDGSGVVGQLQGNEIRLKTSGFLGRFSTEEGMKRTITHELGHWMDANKKKGQTVLEEIEADAFALRYVNKFDYVFDIMLEGRRKTDAVIKRALEMEREERENLNRLRNIAGLPPQDQPQSFSTAQSYFYSGKAALDRKENDKARAYFSLAIGLDPNNKEAYYYRSEANWGGNGNGNVADLTEALRLDPNNNTYKEALKVAQEKQSARSYFDSGRDAYLKRDYDKAIADYTEVIRLDPNFVFASAYSIYYERGQVYSKKGDYDKAIADFTEIIQRDPSTKFYYEDRAEAYMKKGDYIKAIVDYTEVVVTNRRDERTERIRRRRDEAYSAYMAKKDFNKAIADFTELIRLNPYYADYLYFRANAYIAKKDYDKAIADSTEAIRKPKGIMSTFYYSSRAEAYFGKRKYKEAREDVNRALQLDSNNLTAKTLDAELKKKKF